MSTTERPPLETRVSGSLSLETRAGSDGPTLAGLAVPFNVETELPGFTEVWRPQSLARLAAGEARDVKAYAHHDPKLILGRQKARTLVLTVTPRGLEFRLALPRTSFGADVAEQVKRQDLDGISLGFVVLPDGERLTRGPSGRLVREVLAADVHELSLVHSAAYQTTDVHVEQRVRDWARGAVDTARQARATLRRELELRELRLRLEFAAAPKRGRG